MLEEVLVQYLHRFNGSYTDSVYNAKGIEDYNDMRRCYDYLECDKNIFTKPRTLPAGLRNIGNTCYLNTVLQLMFHINYLRQKICTTQNLPSKLHQKLQFLFGSMAVGKMPFADPTDVFEELRVGNSQVFAPGVQNDFHEVLTLFIDSIGEGYKNSSPEDFRFMKKLLFGKMITRISYQEEKLNLNTAFNIINLTSSQGNFSKAFEKWRRYSISDFVTPNGKKVVANCENLLLETPALLGFFINRVTYVNGKLEKDCRAFGFEDSILVAKAVQSQKTVLSKSYSEQKQKELNEQKQTLLNWLKKAELQRQNIALTIKYLKQKQVPLLSEPTNPMGEQARIKTLQFLEQELIFLGKHIIATNQELQKLNEQMSKLQQEQNYQRYLLWGVMIHEGNSAIFGHYKLCLSLGEDWYEFNDKIVKKINRESIKGYSDRGEICCLFYRRPTLICDNKKIPIPFQLKNSVTQYQGNLKKDIDKSRLLQLLYQETQSAQLLLDFQLNSLKQQRFQLFFKSVHYALSTQVNRQVCKGILLEDMIRRPEFSNSLKDKLICDATQFKLPVNLFGLPIQYYEIREAFCRFLDHEITFVEVGFGYKQLSKSKLKFGLNKQSDSVLYEMLQVVILKGLYYLKILSEYNCKESIAIMTDLSEGLQGLLSKIKTNDFSLVCISIKASIQMTYIVSNLPYGFQKSKIQDYGLYFSQSFKFWINQRNNFDKIDETNWFKGVPPFSKHELVC